MTPDDLITIEGQLIDLNRNVLTLYDEIGRTTLAQQQTLAAVLFLLGCGCAVFVVVLLYKFLRKFF